MAVVLTAMRQADNWAQVARLADRHYGQVVAFDIAGPEAGWPASRGAEVMTWLRERNIHLTIHAGEAVGVEAITDAVARCGAERLGHGVRLADGICDDGAGGLRLSRLAAYVRDRRIALELCPTSNVDTGAYPDVASHPFDRLYRAGLRVTVNTDNRLMSATSMTDELWALVSTFGYTVDDVARFALNAAKAAFADHETRGRIVRDEVVAPYALLGARL